MGHPLVSVLVTTFNHGRWIEQALDSVLSQTYPRIEIIIHNDNSTDDTAIKLKKYSKYCNIIHNNSGINIGISPSVNKLVSESKGKYIAFFSGDDVWHENKIEKQTQFMEENLKIDICFTDSLTINEIEVIGDRFSGFSIDNYVNRKQWVHRLIQGNCLLGSSAFLRSSIPKPLISFDTTLRQLQDWDVWLRLACKGYNFALIEEPLSYYRVLNQSVSNTTSPDKSSRDRFETVRCLKNISKMHLGEIRELYGAHFEEHPMFLSDKCTPVAAALIISKLSNYHFRWAAAEILRDHFLSGHSSVTDAQYHEFIGALSL